jgi:uridine kinase
MLMIGIGGGSASGKSTLAAKLAAELADRRVGVLHTDDFFAPVKPKMVSRFSGRELDDFNQPASWRLDDFRAALAERAADPELEVLIVEGIFALFDAEIRGRYDLTVFVDTPSDERFFRRIRRRLALGVTLEEEADYFLGTQRFRHQEFYEPLKAFADLVIGGSEIGPRKVEVLAAYLRSRLP